MNDWLRKIRAKKSLYEIAKNVIPQSIYFGIEAGVGRPSGDMTKRIAAVMGFDWTRFFEDEKGREPVRTNRGGNRIYREAMTV